MKKILIIEDDNVLRGELKILLGANGYEAEEVTDFEDAAGLVLAAEPDTKRGRDHPESSKSSRPFCAFHNVHNHNTNDC